MVRSHLWAALLAWATAAAPCVADIWDAFHISVEPSTDAQTFDIDAYRWFPDSGYLPLEQSIQVTGNEISVYALLQDQHTRPGSAFLTVMTPRGAYFEDVGPLAPGTYTINAEIWLTPWPDASGGYLYDSGTLDFTVVDVGAQVALPGDINNDQVVDASDYVVWRRTNGTDQSYEAWRDNFGATSVSGSGQDSPSPDTPATPEPSGVLLTALVVAAVLNRRLRWRAG